MPDEPTVLRDLTYADVQGHRLGLDLYLPATGAGPVPTVVWVHGGAWYGGDKAWWCHAAFLATRGYTVASVNYRLSGDAIFPAQIHDVKGAIRWLRAHADEYRLDPLRFGAWGDSAGGHLVALLGTSYGVPELEGDTGGHLEQSSRVQAVCDWFGPTDMLQIGDHPGEPDHYGPDSAEAKLFGGPVHARRELVTLANPITHVRPDAPPFLIQHGDLDAIVPYQQSDLLADALRASGVPVTLEIVRGAGHGFHGSEAAEAADFFDRHLRPHSES